MTEDNRWRSLNKQPGPGEGELLSRVLQGAAPEGACLGAEEIDALVEQRASDADRERYLAHLATCEPCLRSFGVAAELRRQEDEAKRRRKLWTTVPLALAALMVLALSVTLTRQDRSQQVALHKEAPTAPAPQAGADKVPGAQPPAAPQVAANPPQSQPARTLPGQPGKAVPLVPPTGTPGAASEVARNTATPSDLARALPTLASLATADTPVLRRGFAARQSVEKGLLLAGADLLEARLQWLRGQGEEAAHALNRAAGRLPSGPAAPPEAAALAALAADSPAAAGNVMANRLEQMLSGTGANPYLMLGAWTQATLNAASAGDPSFFATDWFLRAGNTLSAAPLKEKVAAKVREIMATAAKVKEPGEYARLIQLVQGLKELL